MVTCDHPSYGVTTVRLLQGDRNPDGQGFEQTEVDSPVEGDNRP
jgi:hypothetical protein